MTNDKYKEMRLIMMSGDFPPQISGVGDYAFHISRTASNMGVNVKVICTQSDSAKSLSLYGSLDVRPIMYKWRFSEIKNVFQILRDSDKNTVVNIQYGCLAYGRQLMINFLPFFIRVLLPHVKIVITLHGFWEQSVLYRLRALPMLRFAHGIIYVDRLNKKLVKKYSGLPDERMKFIPIAGNIPPIPCTEEQRATWRKELGFSNDDVIVTFFGGIRSNKGFEYLVEATAQLRKNNLFPIILLAIGGFRSYRQNKNYEIEVLNLIKKMGIEDYVKVLDDPDPKMVSQYLHVAHLAVYPFLQGVGENSGSMLAALAHGLPTIITAGPANISNFSEKLGVVMIPAMNSEKIVDAIRKIIASPALQNIMRNKALEVSKSLNWEFITLQEINFFSYLINNCSLSLI